MGRGWRFLVAALLITALAAAGIFLVRVGALNDGKGEYVLVLVSERNSRALRAVPVGAEPPRSAAIDPEAESLWLGPEARRALGGRIMVVHRVESMGRELGTRVFALKRVPGSVPLGQPLIWAGRVAEGARPINLVANHERLLERVLEINSLAPGGAVELVYGSHKLTLAPGEGWSEARWRSEGGTRVIALGPAWAEELKDGLASGEPLTVVSIYNFGLWPRARITVKAQGRNGP